MKTLLVFCQAVDQVGVCGCLQEAEQPLWWVFLHTLFTLS